MIAAEDDPSDETDERELYAQEHASNMMACSSACSMSMTIFIRRTFDRNRHKVKDFGFAFDAGYRRW